MYELRSRSRARARAIGILFQMISKLLEKSIKGIIDCYKLEPTGCKKFDSICKKLKRWQKSKNDIIYKEKIKINLPQDVDVINNNSIEWNIIVKEMKWSVNSRLFTRTRAYLQVCQFVLWIFSKWSVVFWSSNSTIPSKITNGSLVKRWETWWAKFSSTPKYQITSDTHTQTQCGTVEVR